MSRDLPWVFTCSHSRRALSGFFYSWHSIDRADNGRNSYIESSAQAEINNLGRLFLTVHNCARSIPKVGGERVFELGPRYPYWRQRCGPDSPRD